MDELNYKGKVFESVGWKEGVLLANEEPVPYWRM